MGDHGALAVGTTGGRRVAHVLAAVQYAGFLVGALIVTTTANLTPLLVADLPR